MVVGGLAVTVGNWVTLTVTIEVAPQAPLEACSVYVVVIVGKGLLTTGAWQFVQLKNVAGCHTHEVAALPLREVEFPRQMATSGPA